MKTRKPLKQKNNNVKTSETRERVSGGRVRDSTARLKSSVSWQCLSLCNISDPPPSLPAATRRNRHTSGNYHDPNTQHRNGCGNAFRAGVCRVGVDQHSRGKGVGSRRTRMYVSQNGEIEDGGGAGHANRGGSGTNVDR